MGKALVAIFFIIVLVFGGGKGWHFAKDGFAIRKIQPKWFKNSSLGIVEEGILSQNFRYLGKGHQNYAFISDDGKYVLKLPRYDIYEAPFWLRALPLEKYRQAFLEEKKNRFTFLINSFLIAFNELKVETSVSYVHLDQTDCLHRYVKITDRIGRSYLLDLDKTGFLLQKKHDLFVPLFCKEMEKGNLDEAKRMLEAFLVCNLERAVKGVHNKDPSFLRNFALDGTRVIQIDVGSFYHQEALTSRKSFLKMVGHFQDWLENEEMKKWIEVKAEEMMNGKI